MSNKTYIAYILGYLTGFTLTWICTFYIWKWLYITYKIHWLEARNKWWKFWYGFVCLFYVGWWFGVFDHLKWGGILITIFVSIKYFQYRSRESLTIGKKVIDNISIRNKPQRQTEKKTQWVSKKNKIMHRIFQIFIISICLCGIGIFTSLSRNVFTERITTAYYKEHYYKDVDWKKYKSFVTRHGMPKPWESEAILEGFRRWKKSSEGWEYSWHYSYQNNQLASTFWNFQQKYDTANIENIQYFTARSYTKTTKQIIKRTIPISFKKGLFSTHLLGFLGITAFLLWSVRIRKYTPEEKRLKKDVEILKNKILEIEERRLLSEKEIKQFAGKERTTLIKRFLERFINDKKRPIEYKLGRFFSLKEDKTISEEEFKEAKKQLIEQEK